MVTTCAPVPWDPYGVGNGNVVWIWTRWREYAGLLTLARLWPVTSTPTCWVWSERAPRFKMPKSPSIRSTDRVVNRALRQVASHDMAGTIVSGGLSAREERAEKTSHQLNRAAEQQMILTRSLMNANEQFVVLLHQRLDQGLVFRRQTRNE